VRILLVEDETAPIVAVREELEAAGIHASITEAGSKDSAVKALAASEFDVVVCDLRIPTVDGALDKQDEHGVAVIMEIVANHPSSKVLILSGFATMENIGGIANRPERDLFGTGTPEPVVVYAPKGDYSICIGHLARVQGELQSLDDIELECTGLVLSEGQRRAVQVYARMRDGRRVEVRPGAPGLSGATTFRISIFDGAGLRRGQAFVKLDDRDSALDEERRFHRHVAGTLPAGSHPSLTASVLANGGQVALFYTLLGGPATSLFEALAKDEAKACEILAEMQATEDGSWLDGASSHETTVREVRVGRGGNEVLMDQYLVGVDWRDFETRKVLVRGGVQHGDMHGENVMVEAGGKWFLVDFAHTGPADASVDAVQLELSLLFHPNGRAIVGAWPSLAELAIWPDVESYAITSPVPAFIRATRSWAFSSGGGRRAVLATAYGHATKQLCHPNMDPTRVHALVTSIIAAW